MTSHLEDHVIPASRQREKARDNLKWIGQDMKRVEDPRLLTGKGKYIDDLELPNMAYAAVLGSPHAHARVKSIDISKAQEILAALAGAEFVAAQHSRELFPNRLLWNVCRPMALGTVGWRHPGSFALGHEKHLFY